MRRFVMGLAIGAIACLSPAWALAGDQETAQRIADSLRGSGQLVDYSIGVKYQDGTAWLMGRVANDDQVATAIQLVEQMPDVSRVVNKLEIKTSAKRQLSPAAQAAQSASTSRGVVRLPAKNVVRNSAGPVVRPLAAAPAAMEEPEAQLVTQETLEPESVPDDYAAAPMDDFAPEPAVEPNTWQQRPRQAVGQSSKRRSRAGRQVPLGQRVSAQGSRQPMRLAQAARPGTFRPGQARQVPASHGHMMQVEEGVPGGPIPTYIPGANQGIAVARYDQPHMPNYAWPSYAAYPNYAGVSYPKQYSPTAWPYIGPFYPYPQVPLGWRKVTLEWDDGWWFLDFDDR